MGLLAGLFLNKNTGETIIHDPRVVWNSQDAIYQAGGKAIISKTGHAFIKKAMREYNAVYGGEISAHHYFRDFAYCDSGMIPWIMIWETLSQENNISLSNMISDRRERFPSSGEINFTVKDPQKSLLV